MKTILKNKKFLPLSFTHFFGALDDNLLRHVFIFLTSYLLTAGSVYWLALAFVLYGGSFLTASLYAGNFADKFPKNEVIKNLKLMEIGITVFTLFSIWLESRLLLLVALCAFGACNSFVRTAKYALIPELVGQKDLLPANALMKSFSFLSVFLAGASLIVMTFSSVKGTLLFMGTLLIASSVFGWIFSLKIPKVSAADPSIELSRNPIEYLKTATKTVEENPDLKFYLTSIAWYWLLGAVIVFFSFDYSRDVLVTKRAVWVLLTLLFSTGYIVGSWFCAHFFRKKKFKGLVPLSCVGVSLFILLTLWAVQLMPLHSQSMDLATFLTVGFQTAWLMFNVFALAFCAACFIIPFFPFLQEKTPRNRMGRLFAYTSFICCLAVIGAVLVVLALSILHLPLTLIFILMAVANLLFAVYTCQLLPIETRRQIFKKILTKLFKVKVEGLENLDTAGKRVLIVPNHTSYLDGLFISTFIDKPITFSLSNAFENSWWIRFLGNLMEVKFLDPTSPLAVKEMVGELKQEKLCMIFTEARMPGGNTQMKIYEGAALMAQKADAKILPIQILGLDDSAYSRLPTRKRFNLFPKVTLKVESAFSVQTKKKATFREERAASSMKLYTKLAQMRLDACNLDRTLLEASIDAMHHVGRNKQMMEDTERKPLKFKHIFLRAFILGGLINKALPDEKTLGIMLPTSNACVLTLLGLHAYGKIPAMINFSSGPKQVVSTCQTAQIKKVLTAKKVVLLGKLEGLVQALTDAGIDVVYLEDLKPLLTLKDKLIGIWGMLRPRAFCKKHAGDVKATDPCVILFTSGSEGLPKAVLLSHKNVLANSFQVTTMFDIWENDVMLNCLPIFHSFGLMAGVFLPLVVGFKLASYPTPLHYRVIPEFCSSVRATIFFATDTFLAGYAKCANPYDFNSLRVVGAGAEKLKEETRRTWSEKFGVRILEGYGATECSPIISVNTFLRSRSGSVGCLVTGLQHKFREVPGITEGKELIVKGPNVMIGYMKHDKPGVLQPPQNGWYETGDIIHMDEDGYVFIKGRSKRFAKIAGEMVSLLAVELAISTKWPETINGIVSVPDVKKGEQLVLITNCADITNEKLMEAIREAGLTELAIPKKIMFMEKPPLFGTGKFDYPTATELARKEMGI